MRLRNFMHSRAMAMLSAIALLLSSLPALAQLSLGDMTYSRAVAPVLRQPVNFSPRFFRGVGGVAFNAVADGDGGMFVQSIRYDASAPDGDRLVVTVSQGGQTRTARGRVHDWILVPTARFANDENGSAMTLFGRLENEAQEKRVLDAKGRVINYHPALDNTLVGLRMLHADILIIQPNAVHLFQRNGQTLLGGGEGGHDVARNRDRFNRIGQWQREQSQRGNTYQSYVVGDLYQRVTFTVRDGRLEFTGYPYWAAWRPKFSSQADRDRQRQLATRHDDLVRQYNSQVDSYNARRQAMSEQDRSTANFNLNLTKSELENVRKQYEAMNEVEQMTAYSRQLSDEIRRLDGVNPVVYRALTNVMHYRALFKHYQKRDAAGFDQFLRSVANVAFQPAVETPTIQSN